MHFWKDCSMPTLCPLRQEELCFETKNHFVYESEERLINPSCSTELSEEDDWKWIPLELDNINKKSTSWRTNKKSDSTPQSKPASYVNCLKTKNIVKNYGNAIAAFAVSPLAHPYLENELRTLRLTHSSFVGFVNRHKNKLRNINNLRNILIPDTEDSNEEISFKHLFKLMAEIFIKYFSVNWIFNGRVKHKEEHLKYRFKMLRRIQNPNLFTYLNEKARTNE